MRNVYEYYHEYFRIYYDYYDDYKMFQDTYNEFPTDKKRGHPSQKVRIAVEAVIDLALRSRCRRSSAL